MSALVVFTGSGRATITKAFTRLRAGAVEFLPEQARARILGAHQIRDAGELDASDCDNIVQVGLFGEVRYG